MSTYVYMDPFLIVKLWGLQLQAHAAIMPVTMPATALSSQRALCM